MAAKPHSVAQAARLSHVASDDPNAGEPPALRKTKTPLPKGGCLQEEGRDFAENVQSQLERNASGLGRRHRSLRNDLGESVGDQVPGDDSRSVLEVSVASSRRDEQAVG